MQNIHPIIFAGASGGGDWIFASGMYPAQDACEKEDKRVSFLQATIKRLRVEDGFAAPTVICHPWHRAIVEQQLAELAISARCIILDRSSTPNATAVAAAAQSVTADDPNAICTIMQVNHVVENAQKFAGAVKAAAESAAAGKLVLFGARPPATAEHGYVRRGRKLSGAEGIVYAVSGFKDSVAISDASFQLDKGRYFSNSGIVVARGQSLLEEIARVDPTILQKAQSRLEAANYELSVPVFDGVDVGDDEGPISINQIISADLSHSEMLTLDTGWVDAGAWPYLVEAAVHASQAAVDEAVGGATLVEFINSPDVVVVASSENAEQVVRIIRHIQEGGPSQPNKTSIANRSWGSFESIDAGPMYKIKLIHVNAGARLKTRRHHHRSEHWVVLRGTARVTVENDEHIICKDQTIYIPPSSWHELENPGCLPLSLVEVQIGPYLGEDDVSFRDEPITRSCEEK